MLVLPARLRMVKILSRWKGRVAGEQRIALCRKDVPVQDLVASMGGHWSVSYERQSRGAGAHGGVVAVESAIS